MIRSGTTNRHPSPQTVRQSYVRSEALTGCNKFTTAQLGTRILMPKTSGIPGNMLGRSLVFI